MASVALRAHRESEKVARDFNLRPPAWSNGQPGDVLDPATPDGPCDTGRSHANWFLASPDACEAWHGPVTEANRLFPIWDDWMNMQVDSAYRIDGVTRTIGSSWTLKTPIPLESSGLTSVELTLRDRAGNLSAPLTIQYRVSSRWK